jgi:hypothetical protein
VAAAGKLSKRPHRPALFRNQARCDTVRNPVRHRQAPLPAGNGCHGLLLVCGHWRGRPPQTAEDWQRGLPKLGGLRSPRTAGCASVYGVKTNRPSDVTKIRAGRAAAANIGVNTAIFSRTSSFRCADAAPPPARGRASAAPFEKLVYPSRDLPSAWRMRGRPATPPRIPCRRELFHAPPGNHTAPSGVCLVM